MIRLLRRPPSRPKIQSQRSATSSGGKAPEAGDFAIRVRRTISAPARTVFAAWADARRRARWLSGVKPTVRKTVSPAFVHLICEQGTSVEVRITAKGAAKCSVVVDHTKLPDAKEAAARKICWGQLLTCLENSLSAPRPTRRPLNRGQRRK